jgi:aspartate/glutamate racemase
MDMKKVGLIGGISWVSTMDYYKFINKGVNAKLGEIPMLISQEDFEIPIFDTTKIHAEAIVEYIVSQNFLGVKAATEVSAKN